MPRDIICTQRADYKDISVIGNTPEKFQAFRVTFSSDLDLEAQGRVSKSYISTMQAVNIFVKNSQNVCS